MNFLDELQPGRGRLAMDPGEGNLQENALRAAIIGPYRIAHGSKRTVNLQADEPQRVANLAPAARHCAFVALFLPASQTGPLNLTVGQEDNQGDSAGVPVSLETRVGPLAGISFSCILLPGETLIGQSPIPCSLVVSEVYF